VYGNSVGSSLVSDDYFWIGIVGGGVANIGRYHGGSHYNPVALAFLYLEHALFGPSAIGYHIGSLALFLLTALMVGRTGLALGIGRAASWSGAVLFASSSLLFEAPLWAIGIFYTLSTLLYLLGLQMFVAYDRTRRTGRAVASIACLVLALLTHEQAISLVGACLAWKLVNRDWSVAIAAEARADWRAWILELLVPALLVAGFVATKLVLGQGEPQAPGLSLGRSLSSPLAANLARVFIPNLPADHAAILIRPAIPESALVVWRVALVAAGIGGFVAVGRRAKFLIAWAALQVAVMVAGIGGMTSRHFVLPLVPSSILAAATFRHLARSCAMASAARWPRSTPIVYGALFGGLIAGCAMTGVLALEERSRVWQAASLTADRILEDVGVQQAVHPDATRLYAVDLPDGLPLRGETEPAYVFRLGFASAVEQRHPQRFQLISTVQSAPADGPDRRVGTPLSPEDLEQLIAEPRNLVVRYENPSRRLQVLR